MNYINKFNEENIHLFDLTALGQESYYICINEVYLYIPFYKLGYFPERLEYAFHMGYLVFKNVNQYSVERLPYSSQNLDYNDKIRYDFQHKEIKSEKSISLDSVSFHFNHLTNYSLDVKYGSLHIMYDKKDYDCSPTKFSELPLQKDIANFLKNENLEWIIAVRHFITNKMR